MDVDLESRPLAVTAIAHTHGRCCESVAIGRGSECRDAVHRPRVDSDGVVRETAHEDAIVEAREEGIGVQLWEHEGADWRRRT